MARLILGEATRTLDERYRLSIPVELAEAIAVDRSECIAEARCSNPEWKY